MAVTVGIIGAVTAAASAGYGIYQSENQPSSSSKMPTPPKPDYSQMGKTMLPGTKADAAARVGGGMSPQFLEGLVGQQTGVPGQDLGILSDIQRSLGQGGGGGFQGP